jgi:lipopolysaccharide/colanic/teichoic acid biosynthesis glycosyltransferase
MAKRLLDIALAGFLLLFCAPLLVAIALWVWLDSGFPVLYRQVRAGRGGKPFWIVKFRTMVIKKTSQDLPVTSACDPRITRSGRILRRLKLDELPQLWNVLRGEMSLVGPRPQTFSLLPCYPPEDLQVILSVRPGLTGPTQLWLRDEEEILARAKDPMAYYVEVLLPQKIASDRAYVENCSLGWDFWIILQTFLVLFFPRFAPKTTPAPVQGRGFIVRG